MVSQEHPSFRWFAWRFGVVLFLAIVALTTDAYDVPKYILSAIDEELPARLVQIFDSYTPGWLSTVARARLMAIPAFTILFAVSLTAYMLYFQATTSLRDRLIGNKVSDREEVSRLEIQREAAERECRQLKELIGSPLTAEVVPQRDDENRITGFELRICNESPIATDGVAIVVESVVNLDTDSFDGQYLRGLSLVARGGIKGPRSIFGGSSLDFNFVTAASDGGFFLINDRCNFVTYYGLHGESIRCPVGGVTDGKYEVCLTVGCSNRGSLRLLLEVSREADKFAAAIGEQL